MRKPIDTSLEKSLRIREGTRRPQMGHHPHTVEMRLVDDGQVNIRGDLWDGALSIVDPNLHEVHTVRLELLDSSPALDRVARLGDGYHFVGGRSIYQTYADAMRRAGRDPRSIPVYDSRDFYLGEDDQRAWEESREHIFHSYSGYAQWGREAAEADGNEIGPEPAESPEAMREQTDVWVGGPETIIAKFEERLAQVPIDGTVMRMPPGIDHDRAVQLMTRVAERVLPHFRD